MNKILLLSILFTVNITAFASMDYDKLPTEKNVEIAKFTGKWYTITALPLFFNRKCLGQTAEYEILNSESISVFNTYIKKEGKKDSTISGKAIIKDSKSNAELNVYFDSFFFKLANKLFNVEADYNIIKLDPNYEYVIVGGNNRKSLWIMSRRPSMPEELLLEYIQYAKDLGFDTKELRLSTRF